MSTIDLTKFKKHVTGKLNIPIGFSDPKVWIDTGNYALNRLISGDYAKGVPLSKVTMFAGETGSGKSLIAANVMKTAQQEHDAFVFRKIHGRDRIFHVSFSEKDYPGLDRVRPKG